MTMLRCAVALAVAAVMWSAVAEERELERELETVVVTAEKRTENLQDLPQAVTALDGEGLDIRNILTFVDLSAVAPGVTVAKNEGFKTVISIRGVGNEANQNAIANPSVSYHMDGIYVASPFALHTGFLDIERIEVLRGPQGTLFGQNSTGGAINVVSRTPTPQMFEGQGDVTVGNYNLLRTRASINVPLGETLAARVAATTHRHDGFSTNLTLGKDLDQADSVSARVRLGWTPSASFRVDLIAQVHDENTNGAAQKGILDTTPNARQLRQDSPGRYVLNARLFSMVAQWDMPAATLKSLTSYQDDDIFLLRDNDRHDLASLPPFTLPPAFYNPETNRQKTRTQEFQLVSAQPTGRLADWVAGIFFLRTAVDITIREYIDFGFDGTFNPVSVADVRAFKSGDYGFLSDSRPERDSRSVYGQGTILLGDRSRLVAGVRYTWDEVNSAVTNFFGRSGTDHLAIEGTAATGRLAWERDAGAGALFYASYTRGFKPGGSNLTYGREDVIAPIVVLPTFKDETVDAFELGLKWDATDRRTRLNAALFFYDYRNLQYQATDPEVFEGGVGNIPESRSYGAEIEFQSFLADRLFVDARLAWLNTEITGRHLALDNVRSDDATNALLAQGLSLFGAEVQRARAAAITDVQGNELAKTPGFTADVLLRYSWLIGTWSELAVHARYKHRGEFQHRIFNNPRTDRVRAYDIFNLSASLLPMHSRWRCDLIAANVTDKAGVNARFTDVFGVGATGEELIAPRQIMLRVGVQF